LCEARNALDEMVCEKIGEPMLAKAVTHEALQDVHVGVAVPLDDHGAVFEDGDVPADDDAVGELAVGRDRELFRVVPQRK
jgi:hypothetical protein